MSHDKPPPPFTRAPSKIISAWHPWDGPTYKCHKHVKYRQMTLRDLFVFSSDLEKCSITSLAHQWIQWNIVMFLSAVWTLILTAPIHCRASIGEQMMQCYISPNLKKFLCQFESFGATRLMSVIVRSGQRQHVPVHTDVHNLSRWILVMNHTHFSSFSRFHNT